MKLEKYLTYTAIFILIFSALQASASTTLGTISNVNYQAQLCESPSCPVTSSSALIFANMPTLSAPTQVQVMVQDTKLSGSIYNKALGYMKLDTILNDGEGNLSGIAKSEKAGSINFGPFKNSDTQSVVIGGDGKWNGFAWSENYGWIKFDCRDVNYCVETDWRPISTRQASPVAEATNTNDSGVVEAKSLFDILVSKLASIPVQNMQSSAANAAPETEVVVNQGGTTSFIDIITGTAIDGFYLIGDSVVKVSNQISTMFENTTKNIF